MFNIMFLIISLVAFGFFAALCLLNMHRAIIHKKETLYATPIAIILFIIMLVSGIFAIVLI
jgi:uncharacterized membrane protein YidH (DUF202 family)